jgi:PPOX class probable F420-dependent enzyme
MHTMSDGERRAFLMEGTRTGHLATVGADGRAHVAPVWFVLDGDDVVFTTAVRSAKGRNLARQGRAALSVDDATPMYSFVHLEGPVVIDHDLGEMHRWTVPISARYMGVDRAEEYARRNAVESECLVRLTPETIVAEANLAE